MNAPVLLGSWSELQPLAAPLRLAVFVDEQQVPAELEWDEEDAFCLHAVVLDGQGGALATGRLLRSAAGLGGMGRIGRMAVRRDSRGAGLGGQVLDALIEAARQRGDTGVLLHAQCSAQGFYAGRGFAAQGEGFSEAGIPHIEMVIRF